MSNNNFLPKKGNYKGLLSYQKSLIVYDCTFIFCERFLKKFDRTIDQMVQAARSGKQNIIEGAKASITSSETEIKLTNVARASLEELLEDYHDFIRTRNLTLWDKNSKEMHYIRQLGAGKIKPFKHELVHQLFVEFLKTRPPEVCANIMIALTNQCNFLLDRQIKRLESDFIHNGGLREQMHTARVNYRKQNKKGEPW